MKTVILCGGRGTRLGEHGTTVPKALITIGGRPILWHLLQIYDHYRLDEIILCLGYLGDSIKQYFRDDHRNITFADTGVETNTGGRIRRIEKYLGDDRTFCATYGDGLADIDLRELIRFHQHHGKIATLTAVHPLSNFGFIKIDENNRVTEFEEKPLIKDWVNGGFFVFERRIFDYLDDNCVLEHEPMERLARDGELVAYRHTGFWKCMDTYKDNIEFNQLWDEGKAGWKVWR
jgi:glucose-1-phosphate cytidylyltransferase